MAAAESTATVTEKMADLSSQTPIYGTELPEETFCSHWATNSTVKLGQCVMYTHSDKGKGQAIVKGTVSFIGEIFDSTLTTPINEGVWVGIYLDSDVGKHNGFINGKKFSNALTCMVCLFKLGAFVC